MSARVDCDRCDGNGHLDGERCPACESLGTVELPDDADARDQQLILAALVKARYDAIAEVTDMLRRTPRYDRDYPALLRAARRIEEWASP